MERRPRQYAAEIVAMPTSGERAAALERVPEHLREWVRDLVEDYFWRRKLQRQRAARTEGR